MELIFFRDFKLSYFFLNNSLKYLATTSNLPNILCRRYVVSTSQIGRSFERFSFNKLSSLENGRNEWLHGYNHCKFVKPYSTTPKSDPPKTLDKTTTEEQGVAKPTIFQRMKQLTKDYWHILIPVHIITSIGWLSVFYVAVTNGMDIIGILQSLRLSEKYLDMLRNSSAGHWAVTYALYKIFTPLRYTVTVGGTTMAIRYLNRLGILKFKNLKEDIKSKKGFKPSEKTK